MPAALVECIPNFSEARRPDVVQEILSSIKKVEGIRVLDYHSDMDHNRTVVTFVGSPESAEEAAYQAISTASRLIDLNQHTGEHPRIGATDVVPFVPISGISMTECVEIARRLGHRVAETLNIPVYLYEDAATTPDRQNLENIRRGQYEGLKAEIQNNVARRPDFGPAELGPAGATVIGARQPLIAFNVYLTTEDVSIAQKIARAVRNSSGGFHYVKAMGVLVDGRAQVSMNLTNYRQSPISRVVEFVRREALRYGVAIHHSELVGLTPQEALVDAAAWYLQMDGFESSQILEQKLFDSSSQSHLAEETKGPDFIERLAAGTPTPGGGSAAAHTGAAAAALVVMVARLTVGKKKYAEVQTQMFTIIDEAENLRISLMEDVDRDAAAFDGYMSAVKMAKVTPEQQADRERAIELATIVAAQVPLQVANRVVRVIELAVEVASLGNLNAISDASTGAALARAALTGAGLNVRINGKNLQNQGAAEAMNNEIKALETKASELEQQLKITLKERAGLFVGE
jgi:glutamate formiminotransferase / formiminotetrahydrofolate cyclodeaminase